MSDVLAIIIQIHTYVLITGYNMLIENLLYPLTVPCLPIK